MTENLTIENYNGIPVRVVGTEIGRAIPAVDIAKALGCSRNAITKTIAANPHLFGKGVQVTHPLPTAGGTQDHVCLTDAGLVAILDHIEVGRAGTTEGKKRIADFQVWGRDTLSAAIKTKTIQSKGVQLDIVDPVKIANDCKRLAKSINGDSQRLIVAAFFKHGFDYFAPHVPPHDVIMGKVPLVPARIVTKDQTKLSDAERPLIESVTARDLSPAPSPKPEGMLSATDIGRIIGKTAEQVNQWLYNNKYIVKDADNVGEWRLDGVDGKTLGTEVPYKPHPASKEVYRVFWNREILEKFNVKV